MPAHAGMFFYSSLLTQILHKFVRCKVVKGIIEAENMIWAFGRRKHPGGITIHAEKIYETGEELDSL